MDRTALYLTTLLMLIMTSSALEGSALSEKQRVKRDPLTKMRSSKWKEYSGWYQQGQYMFPNRNGCGGNITATEEYQYGSLTSPNWPRPLQSQVICTWKLRGFKSLFFVVNGLPRQNRSNEDGRLTVRIPGQSNPTEISLGGDYLHQQVLFNVNRREISLTLTMYLRAEIDSNSTGTKVTWWTIPAPNAAFVKIFNTQLSLGETIQSTDLLSGHIRRNPGYIFIFKNDIISYNAVIRLTLLNNQGVIPCNQTISIYTISYNKGKVLGRPECDPVSKQHTLAVMGYNQSTSTPFGIEIKIPIGVSHVNLSINAALANDTPAYIAHEDCLTAFNTSMTNGLGYYGTANFTAAKNTSVKYKAGLRCDLNVSVPISILDSFFQVETQTDIELSPSCVVDFLQIGGQRVCGDNKPDTYINSPVDNSLIERTGTYYANILQTTTPVFASPSVNDTYNATLALNPHTYQCYVSDPGVSSPFWVVDMVDVFIVQAIIIVAERADVSNVKVVVYIHAKAQPWPEQYYQTCWSGPLTIYSELVSCFRQVSGRYLAIFKESVNLTLCQVEVFVNIAAPLVTWRNVAYGKTIMSDIYPSNASQDSLVDGDPSSCIMYAEPSRSYFYNISLGNREFTVQAVRLYGRSEEPQIGFQVTTSDQSCVDYEGPNDDSMGILVSCTIPMVTNHIFITELMNLTELCEVIIYAEVNDKANVNAALYKEASKSLRSTLQSTSVPEIVDGSLTSCDYTGDVYFVDLGGKHVVEGVILNLGDNQQSTVQVEVWVSHSTSSAEFVCHGKAYTDTEVLQLLCSLPIVGNHVILNITKNHEEVLHLCELQVIAVPYDKENGLQNVALFKHVRQGPMSIPPSARVAPHVIYYGNGARLTVDGDRSNTNTDLTCTTVLGDGRTEVWWEVDLANMYRVMAVGLFVCRVDINSNHLSIEVSDGRAGSRLLCYYGHPRELVNCTQSTLGRYVRLHSLHDLCLCEVEVMATPLTTFERFGERPRHVTSSLFKLFSFVTDGYFEKRGFSSWYKIDNLKDFTSLADCGQLVRGPETILYMASHAHPNDSYICHWMVYTPYDSFILVYLHSLMLTEPVSQNFCLDDVLIISNSAGQQITKCGFVRYGVVNMKSYENDYLHITLMVRKFNNPNQTARARGGINLRFKTYPNCIHKVIKVDPNNTEVLSSPLYPNQLPEYAWCKWILEANVMGFMEFVFENLKLEPVQSARRRGCDMEVLISSKLKGQERFCGKSPRELDLNSGISVPLHMRDRVTIIFTTKENVGPGFQLRYELIPFLYVQVLGYNRTDFQSFGYPRKYQTQNETLTWTFSSPYEAGTIFLNFTDLQQGGGHFKVVSFITLDSRILHTLNDTAYYMITSQPQHFPVFPHTQFELFFVPNGNRGNSVAKFKFTYDFIPASSTVGVAKAYAAEISSSNTTNANSTIRFDRVRLQENILDVDHQLFFILEAGLYVVSLRIVPEYMELPFDREALSPPVPLNLLLKLNNQHTMLTAYGPYGQIAGGTATLKLDKGDILSVFAYPDQTVLYEHTAFAVVYVSPIEGGSAFTGYQDEDKFSFDTAIEIPVNFTNVLTFVSMEFNPLYNTFGTREAGIYWVTLRPGQIYRSDFYYTQSILFKLYKGNSSTFLGSRGELYIPVSVSAAMHFDQGDVIYVATAIGIPGTRSLFSIVHLAKNIRSYTQTADHIAFTGQLGECRWINPNHTTLSFNSIHADYGNIHQNSSTFMIPTSGLYIISIRNVLTNQKGCEQRVSSPGQHLHINVNGRKVVTAFTRHIPTGHVTVLRLNRSDMLTVSGRLNDTVDKDTLFSIAFVDV